MVGQNENIINYIQHLGETSLNKQTQGYHKTRVWNEVRLFVRIQSKDSDSIRFETSFHLPQEIGFIFVVGEGREGGEVNSIALGMPTYQILASYEV